MKRFISIVIVFTFCFVISVPAFATENSKIEETIPTSARAMGYGQDSGMWGEFKVYVPSSESTGQITVRITSHSQNTGVYLWVTNPQGKTIWARNNADGLPPGPLFPNNGAEIKSPTFSNAISGYYTVHFNCVTSVTVDCWIYNW